jgi:hypothetical protein
MPSTNGSRPEIPAARLTSFTSRDQAWGQLPQAADVVVQLDKAALAAT